MRVAISEGLRTAQKVGICSTFSILLLGSCGSSPHPTVSLVVTDVDVRTSKLEGSTNQFGTVKGFAASVSTSDLGILVEVDRDSGDKARIYLQEAKTGALQSWPGWGPSVSEAGIRYISTRSGNGTLTLALRDRSNSTVLTTTDSLGAFSSSRILGESALEVFVETQSTYMSTVFGIDHQGHARKIAGGEWRAGPISPDGQFLLVHRGGEFSGQTQITVVRLADGTIVGTFPDEIVTPHGDRAFLFSNELHWTESVAYGAFEVDSRTAPLPLVAPLLFKNLIPIGFSKGTQVGPAAGIRAKFGTPRNGYVPVAIIRKFDTPEAWIGYCSIVNMTPSNCRQDDQFSKFPFPQKNSLIPILLP